LQIKVLVHMGLTSDDESLHGKGGFASNRGRATSLERCFREPLHTKAGSFAGPFRQLHSCNPGNRFLEPTKTLKGSNVFAALAS
jgi:hypothetical protein